MKIGIFVSDTGGERTGVEELQRRAQWVEENGFTSAWVPQIPWSLDALVVRGAPGEIAAALASRYAGTVDRVGLSMPYETESDTLAAIVEGFRALRAESRTENRS